MANIELLRIPDHFHTYVKLVSGQSLTEAFQLHQTSLKQTLVGTPAEKWEYRYAPGKWSVKEMVQHVIDTERIFCYRALRFARKDTTPLAGFDENDYAAASQADSRSKADLLLELSTVQQSSAQLFASFSQEQLNAAGVASGKEVYVGGMGYIIVGHGLHHRNVLISKYLH